ncbi:MDR family MFS transporter [soil metagenome]
MAAAVSLPAAIKPRTGLNKWGVAVAVAIGALLEIVDTSIVNVALPQIQSSLGATLAQVTWVVSGYAVANVIILPMTAWLGDRFGKKNYFIFSLVGFTMASALCGLSHSLTMLVFARILQGLMGGGLLAKAQAILFETFPREEQAMAQAFFGIIVISGPAIGPTLGGYLVTNIDWRWIFYVNLPVGVVAVMMCNAFLAEDPPKEQRSRGSVDFIEIGLLALGLGCLQGMLENGQEDDWFDSPTIVLLTVVAAVSLILFVGRSLRSASPVVDLRVLRYRPLWSGSLLSVVVGMALYGALFSVPIFAQTILHYTSQDTGILLVPGALASAVAMPIAGQLLKRFDPRFVLIAGAVILISQMFVLGQLTTSTGGGDLFWPLIIRQFGTVMMFLPLSMATLGDIPKKDIGKATGIFSLTRQLGGSVGIALLSTMLGARMVFHKAVIAEKLTAGDPQTMQRIGAYTAGFLAHGDDLPTAKAKAMMAIDGAASVQASVLSFNDTFHATAILLIFTLPLVIFLGKGAKGQPVDAGH